MAPPARRVRRERQQQQPADRLRVDRKLQRAWAGLEARQRGREAPVVPGAVHGRGHAEATVPGLDGADGVL